MRGLTHEEGVVLELCERDGPDHMIRADQYVIVAGLLQRELLVATQREPRYLEVIRSGAGDLMLALWRSGAMKA